MVLVLCGLMFQLVGVDEERSESRLFNAPLSVRVFEIVCVVPAVKVSVSALATDFVKL